MDIKKVEIIYNQLIAIREETPKQSERDSITDPIIWDSYNSLIDELSSVGNRDYSKFKINPRTIVHSAAYSKTFIETGSFRYLLGSLISSLHTEYFPKKQHPYEVAATPLLEQTFSQNNNIEIIMSTVLQINEQLVKKEADYSVGSVERTFIDKAKGLLGGVKTINEAIVLILEIAKITKLPLEKLLEIFS